MSDDQRRLIEVAFPLKQASLDSVHEKSVRHGHISTLHIWPARRPLAACRAALIATLLPGTETGTGTVLTAIHRFGINRCYAKNSENSTWVYYLSRPEPISRE
jgi:adenine-specific DNA methylase